MYENDFDHDNNSDATDEDEPLSKYKPKKFSIDLHSTESHTLLAFIIDFFEKNPIMWNNDLPIINLRDKRGYLGKDLSEAVKYKFKQNFNAKTLRGMFYELFKAYRLELQDKDKNIQEHDVVAPKAKLWCFQQMKFMHGMAVESIKKKPIVLKKEKLIKMAQIFEQFPVLWNWTDDNNHCYEIRRETNALLLEKVNKEMNLNFTATDLQYRITRLKRLCIRNKRLRLKCESKNQPFLPHEPELYESLKYLDPYIAPIVCEHCSKQFENRIGHLKHVAQEHEGRQLTFKCPDCNQEFSQFGHLTIHRRKHTGENLLQCTICQKIFISKALLKKHMLTHTGEKNFICDICGAGFYFNSKLAIHKLKHDPTKFQHQCSYCDKRFAEPHKLRNHFEIHLNRRSHVCQQCGKGFNQKKTLSEHMKTHSNEQKYSCEICGMRFKQLGTLKSHRKVHP